MGARCARSGLKLLLAICVKTAARRRALVNFSGYSANYVKLGPKAKALQEGNLSFYVAFPYGTVPSEDATHCGKLD